MGHRRSPPSALARLCPSNAPLAVITSTVRLSRRRQREGLGAAGPGGHAEGGELAVGGVEEGGGERGVSPAEVHQGLVVVTGRQQGEGALFGEDLPGGGEPGGGLVMAVGEGAQVGQ